MSEISFSQSDLEVNLLGHLLLGRLATVLNVVGFSLKNGELKIVWKWSFNAS